jgi:ABC-type uncharacterized transport system substrate-binding protein
MFRFLKNKRRFFLLTLAVAICSLLLIACNKDASPTPTTHDGEKWRIAYYEGGPWQDYPLHLIAVVDGLAELGWMEPVDWPPVDDSADTSALWSMLSNNVQSDYVEFVGDAYWSADWNDALRIENREAILDRLNTTGDIDLIIAMGTWAGVDLATGEHDVPTVVVSTSNALSAGIIDSAEDSGLDHVHAWVDPTQYERQAQMYHEFVGFDRLGVVYEDTTEGRTYANLAELETVAAEEGFELVTCSLPKESLPDDVAYELSYECFEELAPQIDALWIGAITAAQKQNFPDILTPMFEYDIPTWYSEDPEFVKYGVLMSVSRSELHGLGVWTAEVIASIFNGAKPRDLGQVYELPFAIVINLETARRIGFDVPPGLLEAADLTYETIEQGNLE